MSPSIFDLLGLPEGTGNEELKKAFRRAIREGKYRHPDFGGDREPFERLDGAYQAHLRGEPPPKGRVRADDPSPRRAAPYLSVSSIKWEVAPGKSPESVEVVLKNRGGWDSIENYGLRRLDGNFWWIEREIDLLSGEDIYAVTVASLDVSHDPETYTDELEFFVHDETVRLPISLRVERAAPDSPSRDTGHSTRTRPPPPKTSKPPPIRPRPPRETPTPPSPPEAHPWRLGAALTRLAQSVGLLAGAAGLGALPFWIEGSEWGPYVNHNQNKILLDLAGLGIGIACLAMLVAGAIGVAIGLGSVLLSLINLAFGWMYDDDD